MLLNCGVGEDSRESLDYKEIQLVNLKEINPEYLLEVYDDPVCKTGKKTQMCIPDFWTQRERERVG